MCARSVVALENFFPFPEEQGNAPDTGQGDNGVDYTADRGACPPKAHPTMSNWNRPMLPQLMAPMTTRIRASLSSTFFTPSSTFVPEFAHYRAELVSDTAGENYTGTAVFPMERIFLQDSPCIRRPVLFRRVDRCVRICRLLSVNSGHWQEEHRRMLCKIYNLLIYC